MTIYLWKRLGFPYFMVSSLELSRGTNGIVQPNSFTTGNLFCGFQHWDTWDIFCRILEKQLPYVSTNSSKNSNPNPKVEGPPPPKATNLRLCVRMPLQFHRVLWKYSLCFLTHINHKCRSYNLCFKSGNLGRAFVGKCTRLLSSRPGQ